jgi:hypothetical protein
VAESLAAEAAVDAAAAAALDHRAVLPIEPVLDHLGVGSDNLAMYL